MPAWRWWLPIVFSVVVVSFVGSTMLSQGTLVTIDRRSLQIAEATSPAIEHLSAAKAELRRLQVLLTHLVDNEPDLARWSVELDHSRAAIDRELRAYLALPVFAAEQEEWAIVQAGLQRMDGQIDEVLVLVAAGRLPEAELVVSTELYADAERVGGALERSIGLNAQRAHDLALEIRANRSRATTLALILDAACIVLGILAAFILWRTFRTHTQLMETNRKLLEERAADMERFADRVAHDVLSPIAGIALAVEGARHTSDPTTQDRLLERAGSAVRRVQSIVDGLLDFARAGAPRTGEVSASTRDVLEDVRAELAPYAEESRVTLVFEIADAHVACAPGILTVLSTNLVRNAIKYMDGDRRRVSVRCFTSGRRLRCEVTDTGPGLPAELQRSAFRPYVRAGSKLPGLGLGLATVKRMSEAHGGAAGYTPANGGGSVFWFELPLAEPPRASLAPATA